MFLAALILPPWHFRCLLLLPAILLLRCLGQRKWQVTCKTLHSRETVMNSDYTKDEKTMLCNKHTNNDSRPLKITTVATTRFYIF